MSKSWFGSYAVHREFYILVTSKFNMPQFSFASLYLMIIAEDFMCSAMDLPVVSLCHISEPLHWGLLGDPNAEKTERDNKSNNVCNKEINPVYTAFHPFTETLADSEES